jgi:hypothetical protein
VTYYVGVGGRWPILASAANVAESDVNRRTVGAESLLAGMVCGISALENLVFILIGPNNDPLNKLNDQGVHSHSYYIRAPFSRPPRLSYIINYPFRPVSRSARHQHHTVLILVINARCCVTNAINEIGTI